MRKLNQNSNLNASNKEKDDFLWDFLLGLRLYVILLFLLVPTFLIGGAFLAIGIGFLFISIWTANLIDIALIGITEPEIWEEFIFTDGIRLEWFAGVALNILSYLLIIFFII